MRVKVKFFAMLRERIGKGETIEEIPENTTIAGLWGILEQEYPSLSVMNMRLLYAVNSDYVPANHVLREGDEVVFVPPVSGGVRCID